jgi:hypothetical protein
MSSTPVAALSLSISYASHPLWFLKYGHRFIGFAFASLESAFKLAVFVRNTDFAVQKVGCVMVATEFLEEMAGREAWSPPRSGSERSSPSLKTAFNNPACDLLDPTASNRHSRG